MLHFFDARHDGPASEEGVMVHRLTATKLLRRCLLGGGAKGIQFIRLTALKLLKSVHEG